MRKLLATALCVALWVAVAAPTAQSNAPDRATAQIAKKCKKKHRKHKCKKKKAQPVVQAPGPPTQLPLSGAEVLIVVSNDASQICASYGPHCPAYGPHLEDDPATLDCISKSTLSWTCKGWYGIIAPGYFSGTCEFYEVVERVGYDGVTSHWDPTHPLYCHG